MKVSHPCGTTWAPVYRWSTFPSKVVVLHPIALQNIAMHFRPDRGLKIITFNIFVFMVWFDWFICIKIRKLKKHTHAVVFCYTCCIRRSLQQEVTKTRSISSPTSFRRLPFHLWFYFILNGNNFIHLSTNIYIYIFKNF